MDQGRRYLGWAPFEINQVLAAKGLLWVFAVRGRRELRWNGVLEWCIVGTAGTRLERAVPFGEESLHDTQNSNFDR